MLKSSSRLSKLPRCHLVGSLAWTFPFWNEIYRTLTFLNLFSIFNSLSILILVITKRIRTSALEFHLNLRIYSDFYSREVYQNEEAKKLSWLLKQSNTFGKYGILWLTKDLVNKINFLFESLVRKAVNIFESNDYKTYPSLNFHQKFI